MFRRLTTLAIPITAWLIVVVCFVACATGSRARLKYPPLKPDCPLSIYHSDLPPVQDWDDLGKVEIICNIDDTTQTCFSRLHAEACRMGGDIIYRLPVKPWRPKDEAMGYRAMVAHRRTPQGRDAGPPDPTLPPPATPEEAAGPVIPLTGPGAPSLLPPGTYAPDIGEMNGGAGRDAGGSNGG